MSEKKKGGFFKRLFNKITGSDDKPQTEVETEVETKVDSTTDSLASTQDVVATDATQDAPVATEAPVEIPVQVKVEEPPATIPEPVKKPQPETTPKPKPVTKKLPKTTKTKTDAPTTKPKKSKPAPATTPKSPAKPKPAPTDKPKKKSAENPKPTPEPKAAVPTTTPVATPEVTVGQQPAPKSAPEPAPQPEKKSWFGRLKTGLSKSSNALTSGITGIFTKSKLDADTVQDLEDILIQADLGIDMATRITEKVSKGRFDKEIDPQEVKQILADEVSAVLKPVEVPFTFDENQKPYVILVIGVNGAGKTTTIGKLGAIAKDEGYSLTIAACDTFRAAAIEQLKVWGERIGAQVISKPTGADAAGLAFDAHQQARENGSDILIIDTAGRLQNKSGLMDELSKIVRVLKKQDDGAPHAVLLVLDATTGQNAISQTQEFSKVAGVTGIIMTKLDGTARGGILVAIAEKFKLPIHAIGVGEQLDDFQPFDADAFARAIAGLEDE